MNVSIEELPPDSAVGSRSSQNAQLGVLIESVETRRLGKANYMLSERKIGINYR
jgi:hypothetical protein